MKIIFILAALMSSTLYAQTNCVSLTETEIENIYCHLKSSESFASGLAQIKRDCLQEAAIYEQVSAEINEKASQINRHGGDALDMTLLATRYMVNSTKAMSVHGKIASLELQDMMARWDGADICR